MTDVAWGIIGTIMGIIIGFSLTAIKDLMNSRKHLYVEFGKIWFSFPQLTQDTLYEKGEFIYSIVRLSQRHFL